VRHANEHLLLLDCPALLPASPVNSCVVSLLICRLQPVSGRILPHPAASWRILGYPVCELSSWRLALPIHLQNTHGPLLDSWHRVLFSRICFINMSDGNGTTSLSTSSGGSIVNDVVAVIDVGRIKHAAAFDRAINVSS